jgi:Sigma-54 interaction domain
MEQSLGLESGVDRSPAQRPFARRSNEQRRRAKSPPGDWDLARLTTVNLLVVGAEDEVAKLIMSLWPYLVTPIVVRHRGEPLRLSRLCPPVGTIVVYDVDTLSRREQDVLNRWLSAGIGRARVVSSASESLLPMVEAGLFNDRLYYRLNMVTIDLTSPVAR